MSSDHVGEKSVAYCAGELSDAERRSIETHLSQCAECRADIEHVRLAITALAKWGPSPTVPRPLEERIVRAAANRRTSLPYARLRNWNR